jgi:hypothetical protein
MDGRSHVKSMLSLERAESSGGTSAERTQDGGSDPRLGNRRRAVTYLAAAVTEKNAAERNGLLRRAADLILSSALGEARCSGVRSGS